MPHGPVKLPSRVVLFSCVSSSAPLITTVLVVVIGVLGTKDLATELGVFCIKDLTTELLFMTDLTTVLSALLSSISLARVLVSASVAPARGYDPAPTVVAVC